MPSRGFSGNFHKMAQQYSIQNVVDIYTRRKGKCFDQKEDWNLWYLSPKQHNKPFFDKMEIWVNVCTGLRVPCWTRLNYSAAATMFVCLLNYESPSKKCSGAALIFPGAALHSCSPNRTRHNPGLHSKASLHTAMYDISESKKTSTGPYRSCASLLDNFFYFSHVPFRLWMKRFGFVIGWILFGQLRIKINEFGLVLILVWLGWLGLAEFDLV